MDYVLDGKVVPFSGQDIDVWKKVDTIVIDCFETLSWAQLVGGASCLNCLDVLPTMHLKHPS